MVPCVGRVDTKMVGTVSLLYYLKKGASRVDVQHTLWGGVLAGGASLLERVEDLLRTSPTCRGSDDLLLHKLGVRTNAKAKTLKSVFRARRLVQARFSELKANKEVDEARRLREGEAWQSRGHSIVGDA